MALHLQAQLAEHHYIMHFNLPSTLGFGKREIKSVKTSLKVTARNRINTVKQKYIKFQATGGFIY